MCGIVGFWDPKHRFDVSESLTRTMASTIETRGPDSQGVWVESSHGLALGHQRLSIIDLSPAGVQPMTSPSGRYIMVYNGEIFNSNELKSALQPYGIQYKGHSDTEIMLAAFDQWGIFAASQQFIGMFAFAVWDKQTQTLSLVRDRIGIKPLYYQYSQNVWLFGSELKSLLPHPAFKKNLNKQSVQDFFSFGYVPEDACIFESTLKVKPGTILTLHQDGSKQEQIFWNLEEVIAQARTQPIQKTEAEWIQETHTLLKDCVKRRMQADVPLGAFLSGGIDSSLVVSLMQAQTDSQIKTFSIGFRENSYNEAPFAKKVAAHLGTNHHELYISSKEAMDVIPKLPAMYDEPFADVSQIPTYLVSKLASEHVKVSLSGDGGDELFAGYNRYIFGKRLWKLKNYTPDWMLYILKHVPNSFWDIIEKFPKAPAQFSHKVERALEILQKENLSDCYQALVTQWQFSNCYKFTPHPKITEFIEQFQYWDTLTYLPGDILTKVDRASMAVSLEARVPLLDHRLIAHSWQLPLHLKIKGANGKWILRQILKDYIPENLFNRPKMGFGVPIDTWLREDLKTYAHDVIFSKSLEEFGISYSELEKCWQDHKNKKTNNQYKLWTVMMFQLWQEKYKA